MGSWILRSLLLLICGVSGYYLADSFFSIPLCRVVGNPRRTPSGGPRLFSWRGGLKRVPLRNLMGSFIGLILGMMVANLISNVFFPNLLNYQQITLPLLGRALRNLWIYRSPDRF